MKKILPQLKNEKVCSACRHARISGYVLYENNITRTLKAAVAVAVEANGHRLLVRSYSILIFVAMPACLSLVGKGLEPTDRGGCTPSNDLNPAYLKAG